MQLRAKPRIEEEVQKGLRQKLFSSHVVIQESEESWALGKGLGMESFLQEGSIDVQKKAQRG